MTSLVKKIEESASGNKIKAFVVLLSDADTAESKMKELAKSQKIDNVLLMVDNPAGPPKLKIAKDADVTVVLYDKKKVTKTLAFEKGQLTEKAADEVAAEVKEHAAGTAK